MVKKIMETVVNKLKQLGTKVLDYINKLDKSTVSRLVITFIVVLGIGVVLNEALALAAGIIATACIETYKEYKDQTGWQLKGLIAEFLGIVIAMLFI